MIAHRPRGFALLSVLLVMSIALLLTAWMLRGHRLFIQSAAQQLEHLALRDAALAGEALALGQLRELGGGDRVHQGQAWARTDLGLSLEGAQVQITIEDLAGRYNLNSLLGASSVSPAHRQRWSRLAAALQWPDLELREQPPRLLVDLSQLRQRTDIDGALLARLEPHVALLPVAANLNINTANASQLVALGIPAEVAAAIVLRRPAMGYATVAEFLSQPLLDGVTLGAHGLGIGSRWFQVRSDVRLGQRRLRLLSDVELAAGRDPLQVVQRRLANPFENESAL